MLTETVQIYEIPFLNETYPLLKQNFSDMPIVFLNFNSLTTGAHRMLGFYICFLNFQLKNNLSKNVNNPSLTADRLLATADCQLYLVIFKSEI